MHTVSVKVRDWPYFCVKAISLFNWSREKYSWAEIRNIMVGRLILRRRLLIFIWTVMLFKQFYCWNKHSIDLRVWVFYAVELGEVGAWSSKFLQRSSLCHLVRDCKKTFKSVSLIAVSSAMFWNGGVKYLHLVM